MNRKTTVVLSGNPGRLCNCLVNNARLATFCSEFGFELIDLNLRRFPEAIAYFPSLPGSESNKVDVLIAAASHAIGLRPHLTLWPTGLAAYKRVLRRVFLSKEQQAAMKRNRLTTDQAREFQNHSSVYLSGYLFPIESSIFNRNVESIRSKCQFDDGLLNAVRRFIHSQVAESSDFTDVKPVLKVGVHIRQTDYRSYAEGRYFFEIEQYISWIEEVRGLFADRNVQFFVCSDEINEERKSDFPKAVHFNSAASAFFDLALLSEMDFIIGPPSTFSGWASFVGNVPISHLDDVKSPLDLQNTSPYQINW